MVIKITFCQDYIQMRRHFSFISVVNFPRFPNFVHCINSIKSMKVWWFEPRECHYCIIESWKRVRKVKHQCQIIDSHVPILSFVSKIFFCFIFCSSDLNHEISPKIQKKSLRFFESASKMPSLRLIKTTIHVSE